jgi:hypothetical protein
LRFFFCSFFTATPAGLKISLCRAVCGGGRSQRCPHFPLDFLFGERFRTNSNVFQRIVLARPASAGLAMLRGAPTRRASEKVSSNKTKSDRFCLKEKRKNFNVLYYLNGATGGLNKICVLIVRLRH